MEGFTYKIIEEKYINDNQGKDRVEEFSSSKEMKKSDGQERNQRNIWKSNFVQIYLIELFYNVVIGCQKKNRIFYDNELKVGVSKPDHNHNLEILNASLDFNHVKPCLDLVQL